MADDDTLTIVDGHQAYVPAIRTVIRTLSSAELLTLFSDPIELVAAAAGKVYLPLRLALIYYPGATPYADAVTIGVGIAGSFWLEADISFILTEATEQIGLAGPSPIMDALTYRSVASLEGQALYVSGTENPTAGDGTLTVIVLYQTVVP